MSYSPRFLKFLPWIFEQECEYQRGHRGDLRFVRSEKVKGDPGGLTKWGIDQRSHPDVDIEHLDQAGATQIYWDKYWQPNRCEKLKFGLGEANMNASVNCGPGRAAKLLAVAKGDPEKYILAQRGFYERLAKARPSSKEFLPDWEDRLTSLEHWIGLK